MVCVGRTCANNGMGVDVPETQVRGGIQVNITGEYALCMAVPWRREELVQLNSKATLPRCLGLDMVIKAYKNHDQADRKLWSIHRPILLGQSLAECRFCVKTSFDLEVYRFRVRQQVTKNTLFVVTHFFLRIYCLFRDQSTHAHTHTSTGLNGYFKQVVRLISTVFEK